MIARGLAALFCVLIISAAMSTAANAQRTCHVVVCQQAQAGERCVIQSCGAPQELTCYTGRYAVGDGRWSYRGGTQGQCEQRCNNNPNCNLMEYYYGNEGIRCNLYSSIPVIRWNPSQDATVCTWQ